MDHASVFAIAAAGMGLERTRVEVAAMNLAHANTVHDASGAGWQPLRVVARALPPPAFAQRVEAAADGGLALPSATIEPVATPPRRVHEPGHPLADAQGFVAYAAVDPATEMVTLMAAMRAYEANLAAMTTARTLALKTLEIGRGG